MKKIAIPLCLLLFAPAAFSGTPPSVPSGLSLSDTQASKATLSWTAPSGPHPVAGYYVYRNGAHVGSPSGTTFTDTYLAPSTTFTYTVAAHDANGSVSAQSVSVDATTTAKNILMWDDFETQDSAAWTNPMRVSANGAAIVQSSNVHSGAWALQSSFSAGGTRSPYAYISHNFAKQGVGVPLVYARTFFRIDPSWTQTASTGSTYDLRILQVTCDKGADRILVRNTGTYGSPNFVLRDYLATANGGLGTTSITVGVWHEAELMVAAGNGNGQTAMWLDGVLQTSQAGLTLGNPFQLQLGLSTNDVDSTGSFLFDDVVVDTVPTGNEAVAIMVRRPNTAARAGFPALVTMYGQSPTDVLVATLNGKGVDRTIFRQVGPPGSVRFLVSMRELDKGDYNFTVSLYDQFGNVKAAFVDSLHKYVVGSPPVSIDEYNNIFVNGVPTFMVTPFMVDAHDLPKWIPSVSNYIGWNGGYYSSYNPQQWIGYLHQAGVPGFMGELRIGPITMWTNAQGYRGMNCSGAFLKSGGNGYKPGDTFTVGSGKPGSLSTGVVQTVGANGAVITFAVSGGKGYFVKSGVSTTATSGSGRGLAIDIVQVKGGSIYSSNQGVPPCFGINQPEAPAVVANYAKIVGQDPYTLGYALMDEPDSGGAPGRVPAVTLEALADAWHNNDRNSHPVWVGLYGGFPAITRSYGYLYPVIPQNKMIADIYAFDFYPYVYGVDYPGFRIENNGRDPDTHETRFVRGGGYRVGDTFTIDGGTTPALGQVIDVMHDGSGAVRNLKLLSFGAGYTAGKTGTTTLTGNGSGLRIEIRFLKAEGAIAPPMTIVFPDGNPQLTVTTWVRLVEQWDRLTYGLTPWFNYVNAGIQEAGSTTGTGDTKDEMRMIGWLSIIHKGKGVSWWGPEGWTILDDYDEMVRFKGTVVALQSIIMSPPSSYTVTNNATEPGSRVDFMVREDTNNIWIFAQRLSDSIADPMEGLAPPLPATFTISGLPSSVTRASVYGESRTVPVSRGVLTDHFAPYATHFYVVPKSNTGASTVQ
jgi:hypothetical protein